MKSNSHHLTTHKKPELSRKPILAITGQFQKGKSTLLNCLLGGYYAVEGTGLVTTRHNAKYIFGDFTSARIVSLDGAITPILTPDFLFTSSITLQNLTMSDMFEISAWAPLLQNIDILDSPGYGANERDNEVATQALLQVDFVIYVVSEKTLDKEADLPFLKSLADAKKHFTIIYNCKNDINPTDASTLHICKEIRAQVSERGLDPFYIQMSKTCEVYAMNLLWAQCALGYLKEEEHKKKMQKMSGFLGKDIRQDELLVHSGFLHFRKMVESYVQSYLNWKPNQPLHSFHRAIELWENSFENILTKGQ